MISDTTSATIEKLLELPAADRVEIAMALWESLDDAEQEAAGPLTDEQRAELDRRLASYRANPDAAMSPDELANRLKARRRG